MPLTVDFANKIIYPDRAEMVQIQSSPIAIYQLDVNALHLDLRDLEDDEEGIWADVTHTYKAPTTLSGVTYARLMEIINDYTITFLPDNAWVCQVVGGNSNVGDRVNPNNVSVQVANSAGLQDAESLQAASFQGAVSIDITSSFSGTVFPVGTRETPVNNVTDAIAIAESRGIRTINILSNMTIGAGDFSDGYDFVGESPIITSVTIDAATDITNCRFRNMFIQGTLDNNNEFRESVVGDVTMFNGGIFQSALTGTITLGGGAQAQIYESWSGLSDHSEVNYAEINLGGTGQDLVMRNYTGAIRLSNSTGPANVSLDVTSGRVLLDSSITDGDIEIRGGARVANNTTGTTIVRDETTLKNIEASAYNGHVTVDQTNMTGLAISGTEFPAATDAAPSTSFTEAMVIARERGLVELRVIGPMDILATDNGSGMAMFCRLGGSVVNIAAGAIVNNSAFTNLGVTGTLSSFESFTNSFIWDLICQKVRIRECGISGTITLQANAVSVVEHSFSGYRPDLFDPGIPAVATFDMNGTGSSLRVVGWRGSMVIQNMADANEFVEVDADYGIITIDSTVTAGTIRIRGAAQVIDNSTGTTVVTVDTQYYEMEILSKLARNKTVTDPSTGVMTVYDDDGTTVLFTANLFEDAAGSQAYRGQGAEVRERLT